MKEIRNILFVCEPSLSIDSWVLQSVLSLAESNTAKITFVYAVEEHGIKQILDFGLFETHTSRVNLEDHFHEDLKEMLDSLQLKSLPHSGKVLTGDRAVEIIKTVLNDNIDLVIKQRHKDKGLDQLAQKLFRKCPCPVLVLVDQQWQQKNVLAAIDIEADSEESISLNRSITETAASLANRFGKDCHIFNSWNLQLEMLLHGPRFNATLEDIIALKTKIKSKREEQLAQFLSDLELTGTSPKTHIVEGLLEDVIAEAITQHEIGTFVMGSVGRSGVPGILIGNSAEKILAHAKCTILAIKPDGFVSPVTI